MGQATQFKKGDPKAKEANRRGGIKSGESKRLRKMILQYGKHQSAEVRLPDGTTTNLPLEQIVFCVDLWNGVRRELNNSKAGVPKTELLLKLLGVDPALLSKSVDVTTGGEPFKGFGSVLPVVPGIESLASELDAKRRETTEDKDD